MTGNWPEDSPPASPSPPGNHYNMTTALRKVSGPTQPSPQATPNANSPSATLSPLSNGLSSPNAPWGPPVTIGASGKSGKFIERLQNENASLRRDYNVERSAKEEAQKSLSTTKGIEAKFRAENERLEMLHTTNTRAIERKNRKIDELKAALDAEVTRRQAAEVREQQMATELDNTHAEKNQAVSEAHTREIREKANADALKDGLHRMQTRYERQVHNMTKDLGAITKREQENRKRIMALEVSTDQGRREINNSDEIVHKMGSLLNTYKAEHETMVERLSKEAEDFRNATHERVQNGERLVREMQETKDKMNWTMNLDRLQKESNNPTSHGITKSSSKSKGKSKR
ncbi:hypothetical protein EJ05DRAFT_150096 [Pseudovirgaria hyperparasitica]|uniref:SWI5-dependent HO expression protein 3 n=1 Tax=Pseudovirgaria hyperparasitica TaxID=470096 RepID=A0A6A6VXZ1_9PEZI|nr:uncharacterized protein EJ05DRAFT_150096 [Pseudovirgaria hyperparasitica]KAF2754147.1 hypothetical protein EJ05DRAFT_150096 [Pseudovirgaria hyperparasitica]